LFKKEHRCVELFTQVLPVVEIFVAAYAMRNLYAVGKVVTYHVTLYVATPAAFHERHPSSASRSQANPRRRNNPVRRCRTDCAVWQNPAFQCGPGILTGESEEFFLDVVGIRNQCGLFRSSLSHRERRNPEFRRTTIA
jgi:hypothetical protein